MDKKMIAVCIAVVVVIVAVITVIAVTQNDKYDYSGTVYGSWEVNKEFDATWDENPEIVANQIPEFIKNVDIIKINDYSAKIIFGGKAYIMSVEGNTFSNHWYDTDGTVCDSYGFLKDDVLTINTIIVHGDGSIVVRSDLYGRPGVKVPETYYDFGMKKGDKLYASDAYDAVNMMEVKIPVEGRTLTVNKTDRGFMFYTVTVPGEGDYGCISVPIGGGYQFSVAPTMLGGAFKEFYAKSGDTVTITSDTIVDGVVENYCIKFTPDGTGKITFPEINGMTFVGKQYTVQSGRSEVTKDFTLRVVEQIGPIVHLTGEYSGGASDWYATVTQSLNGGYRVSIFSIFEEEDDDVIYMGNYNGTLSTDLSAFTIYCHAASIGDDFTLIGLIDLKVALTG